MKKIAFVLTEAQISDITELEQLERQLFVSSDGIITKRQFAYHIRKGKNILLAAKQEVAPFTLIGYILVLLYKQSARIYSLGVNPEYQGQGIGRTLLQTSIAQIVAQGITNIHLEFRQENANARKLYESAGFIVTGTRQDYYGKQQDAILMIWK